VICLVVEPSLLLHVAGNPGLTVLKSASQHMIDQPDNQLMLYCNSCTTCEESLSERLLILIEKHLHPKGHAGIAKSFTSGDSLKIKRALMDAFTNFTKLPGDPELHPDGSVITLPKFVGSTATGAANAGVNSKDLTNVKHKGIPFNFMMLYKKWATRTGHKHWRILLQSSPLLHVSLIDLCPCADE
jgi:hypothetical protein